VSASLRLALEPSRPVQLHSMSFPTQAVAPDSTFTVQTSDSPFVLVFKALQSLLQVFNLESLIQIPGHPNSDGSPIWSLLKILVIGLVAEVARRNVQNILAYLSERFFITVSFNERDPCYGRSD
jgi:hypothetical protein